MAVRTLTVTAPDGSTHTHETACNYTCAVLVYSDDHKSWKPAAWSAYATLAAKWAKAEGFDLYVVVPVNA